ncbi:conserved hypothetical protein [Trichinella spiralis]|uniref:hypothetical protein n=1 Tax=Trichinella spiralis TaxID=6334 RepID=UPI0001EFE789|nr:conserved hypothetical protein [Trichinella spiralis]
MTLLAISREPESVCNEALYRLFLPLFNVLIVHTDGIQCLLGICGFSRWVNPFKQKLKYDGLFFLLKIINYYKCISSYSKLVKIEQKCKFLQTKTTSSIYTGKKIVRVFGRVRRRIGLGLVE